MELHHFDIDYHKLRLNVLETFEEGEFVLSKRLKFVRKYVRDPVDPAMFTHLTTIQDLTREGEEEQYRGSIGIFHGLAQCQDTFFEVAI